MFLPVLLKDRKILHMLCLFFGLSMALLVLMRRRFAAVTEKSDSVSSQSPEISYLPAWVDVPYTEEETSPPDTISQRDREMIKLVVGEFQIHLDQAAAAIQHFQANPPKIISALGRRWATVSSSSSDGGRVSTTVRYSGDSEHITYFERKHEETGVALAPKPGYSFCYREDGTAFRYTCGNASVSFYESGRPKELMLVRNSHRFLLLPWNESGGEGSVRVVVLARGGGYVNKERVAAELETVKPRRMTEKDLQTFETIRERRGDGKNPELEEVPGDLIIWRK